MSISDNNKEYHPSAKNFNEFDNIIQEMSSFRKDEPDFHNIDLKRLADEILKEKQRFKELFENAPIGQVIISLDFTIQYANTAFEKIIGENKNNIIHLSIFKYIQPDSVDLFKNYITDIVNIKTPPTIIVQLKNEDWSIGSFQVYCYPDEFSKNNPLIVSFMEAPMQALRDASSQKNEKWLKSIFRVAPVGIGVIKNKIVSEINSKVCEMLGYLRNELLGRNTRIFYSTQEDYDFVSSEIYSQIALYGTGEVETRWKRKDGKIIDILLSYTPFDPNDISKGVTFAAQDITNRKYAEEEIKLNSLQLASQLHILENQTTNIQELLDFALDETIRLTSSKVGYIYFYNEEKKEFTLTSWSRDVIKDLKIDDTTTSNFLDKASILGEIVRQRKEIIINDFQASHLVKESNPNEQHIELKRFLAIPVFDLRKIVAIIGVGNKETEYTKKDVNQLKLIMGSVWRTVYRTKILAENHRLLKALEHSPAHIVITDKEGKIEYVNYKFTEVTGYSPNEIYGKNLHILKSGAHTQEFYKNLWESLKSGKEWRGELLNKRKDGTLYWENNSISCIKNENDEITHFVAIKEDITERKKIEKELIFAKEQAEESSRLKTAFLNNISHEVRTPMNAIVGFAELLYNNNLSKEKQKLYTETINSSSRQLLRIIDDVLEISRLESGSIKLKLNNFSLTELFKDICVTLEKEATSYSLYLTFDEKENETVDCISADREKIKQILSGLIINAFKFTPKGGVSIGYYIHKKKLTFYVKDTGIGIPKSEHKKIFDRFYKVEQNQSYRNKGTGLGLSIAKGLVEIMGGQIWVESEPSKGTTFYFTAFWEPAIKGSQQAETTEKEPSVFNMEVLIVDDELYNFTYLNELLENHATKIYWAKNGIEAINIIENYKIDLILMDLKMPGMNGFEATKIIKEKHPDITIIAQSAYIQADEKENAFKAGCDDYITKPISKNILFRCIQKKMTDNR